MRKRLTKNDECRMQNEEWRRGGPEAGGQSSKIGRLGGEKRERPREDRTRRSDERSRGPQKFQAREVSAQIAAVDGCQPVALHLSVRGDEKVGHQMCARTAFLSILPMDASGQVRSGRRNVVIADSQSFKLLEQF